MLALGSGVCMRSGHRLAADGDGHRRTVLITCGEAPHPQRTLARELLPLAMPAEQHGAVAVARVAAGVLASTRGEGRGRRGHRAHTRRRQIWRRVSQTEAADELARQIWRVSYIFSLATRNLSCFLLADVGTHPA